MHEMFFRSNTKFIEESVALYLLYVIPVVDNTAFNVILKIKVRKRMNLSNGTIESTIPFHISH